MGEDSLNRMGVRVSAGTVPSGDTLPSGDMAARAAANAQAVGPSAARYDFKHPKPAAQGLLCKLSDLHAGFARELSTSLSELARNPIEVKLLGIDQQSPVEFVSRLDNPTCLGVLGAEPLSEPWMVEIQPTVLYPTIDCMLGGSHQSGSTTRRAPTDIELRLASRIFDLLCDQLRAAWRGIADLPLKLMRVECNPRAVKPAGADAGDDLVVIVRFDVVLGQRRGMMRLCVPGKMIEAVCDRLACDQQASDSRSASPENVERIGRQIGPAETEVEVWLAETQISTNDLISLRVGDIITTPQDVSSPAVVAVSGVPKFHARPGAVKGRKAIVITEPLKPDDCG